MTSSTTARTIETSGVLLLDNVDDYLAPSQACINPLFQAPTDDNNKGNNEKQPNADTTTAAVVIPRRKRRTIRPSTPSSTLSIPSIPIPTTTTTTTTKKKKEKDLIQASMADCLACSGCVTTAETVLLEQEHSLTSLRNKCHISNNNTNNTNNNHFKIRVLTISPASWADLFRQLGIDNTNNNNVEQLQRQIVTIMYQIIQVSIVINGTVPLQWSLKESAKEFCDLYRSRQQKQRQQQQVQVQLEIPNPSIPMNALQTKYYDSLNHPNGIVYENKNKLYQNQLPLVSGSCPAVICLIEKSKHTLITHLATTKSPMAMTGIMLQKHQQQQQHNQQQFQYDHWAIMPCHDKKLEASRKDFIQPTLSSSTTTTTTDTTTTTESSQQQQQKDIELVITTKEWYQLLQEYVTTQIQQQQTQTQNKEEEEEATTTTTTTSKDILKYIQSLPLSKVIYDQLPLLSPPSTTTTPIVPIFVTTSPLPNVTKTMTVSSSNSSSLLTTTKPIQPTSTTVIPRRTILASGGYADYIFRYAAKELFQCELDDDDDDNDDQNSSSSIWHPVVSSSTGTTSSSKNNNNVVKSARVANRLRKTTDYYQAILYRHSNHHHRQQQQQQQHQHQHQQHSPNKDEEGGGGGGLTNDSSSSSPDYFYSTKISDSSHPEPVLKFAIANGLQTLNRVFTHLTTSKTTTAGADNNNGSSSSSGGGGGEVVSSSSSSSPMFDYIEAMACPSGCINGGGQLRLGSVVDEDAPQSSSSSTRETPTQTRQRVTATQGLLEVIGSRSSSHRSVLPTMNGNGKNSHSNNNNDDEDDDNDNHEQRSTVPSSLTSTSILQPHEKRTRYHVVPPMKHTMGAAAGVAVQDIQW